MIRQVSCNAITVDPFANRKQKAPNVHSRHKIAENKLKNLRSEKTADTLTSSITTLIHPQNPELKNKRISPETLNKYLKNYFAPYRRFSEKKNDKQQSSPINEYYQPQKVSSDIGSFRNSVQAIEDDSRSMLQSETSNRDPQKQKSKNFCNSQILQISLNSIEQNIQNNKTKQKINTERTERTERTQEKEKQDRLSPIINEDKFNQNDVEEQSFLITSQNYNNQLKSQNSISIESQQEHEYSIELTSCLIKQFRVQLKKTIDLNQCQNQKTFIDHYQNTDIQEEITSPLNNSQLKQRLLEQPHFNQAQSQILNPPQDNQHCSALNTKFENFKITLFTAILIVILFISVYTLTV